MGMTVPLVGRGPRSLAQGAPLGARERSEAIHGHSGKLVTYPGAAVSLPHDGRPTGLVAPV